MSDVNSPCQWKFHN